MKTSMVPVTRSSKGKPRVLNEVWLQSTASVLQEAQMQKCSALLKKSECAAIAAYYTYTAANSAFTCLSTFLVW